MSNQALDLLKLAVQACRNKQFDSAGVLLANASCSSDVDAFLNMGLESENSFDDLEETSPSVSSGESSFKRRRRNSLHRISQMISAAAEAAEDEESDEDEFVEVDPDIPGEEATQGSFSSVSESAGDELELDFEVSESSPLRLK